MNPSDFEILRDLLKKQSGLVVTPDKTYLLESRLNPIAKQMGMDSLGKLAQALRTNPPKDLVTKVVEAMTTNETSFFRDTRPFDLFKTVLLPYLLQNRPGKRLRIWCAAASSGQEPYSLAMILDEMKAKMMGWNVDILGTDISNDILDAARAGIYTQFEVQRGLPISMLMNYFDQVDEKWKIKDSIKSKVKYQYFNLLDPMTSFGKYDIIFCRNVLIYFDEKTKGEVLQRLAEHMEPDSYLLLGGAETVLGITDALKLVPGQRGLYVRPDSPHLKQDSGAKALAS